MSEHFHEFQLAVIGFWACLGIGKGIAMYRRGINVLTPDSNRTSSEKIVDTFSGLGLMLGFWEIIGTSLPHSFHITAEPWTLPLFDTSVIRWPGAVLVLVSVYLYLKSLIDLGVSWRLAVDRTDDAKLITTGIYSKCRHPIYLAFILYFFGTFLINGSGVFLTLAVLLPPLLHLQTVKEDRFLRQRFKDEHVAYASNVKRYGVI